MTQREHQILQLIQTDPMISQQEIADALGITRSSVAVHISNLIRKGIIAGKGYVVRPGSYCVVVGGANVDIGGYSASALVEKDSNPGQVRYSLGGVGRNIAHNMRLLDLPVRLLTAYGDDVNGHRLAASCTDLGLDISYALRLSGETTSTYLYIADHQGEMALAVSDMSICKRISPDYLTANQALLQGAQVVVADANIPAESLEYLAKHCAAPLFIDPVSTTKAAKLLPILDRIHTLKPNAMEASLLAGIPVEKEEDAMSAVDILLRKGVQRIFLTMGARGVLAADKTEKLWLSNLPGNMVSTTGCGDSFMGALVWAWTEGLDLKQSALAGLAAGAITLESPESISPKLSAETLRQRAQLDA